ncbi:MAG: calcium-binding protein [Cyanobacteria bacterium J06635_1]
MKKSSPFKIGDSVVVKAHVKDPDFGIDIGGWQGRISKIQADDDILCIDWDSQTLKGMSDKFIAQCEEEGLGWEQIYLDASDVEVAVARDQPADAERVYEKLQGQHAFDHLGAEGAGIRQILAGVDPDDEAAIWEAWEEHLEKSLQFPFEAEVAEFQERGPLQAGQKVMVQEITDVDGLYGVLVAVKHKRRTLHFPLCDLEATNSKSANYQPVKDYVVWFANR